MLLVRHGKAGKRSSWKKDDRLRPLDAHGRRQAEAIARVGALFVPRRVGAAPLVRCEQTVGPLARSLELKVTSAPRFSDAQFERRPERTVDALAALSHSGVSAVASQGVTIPALLDYLCPQRAGTTVARARSGPLFFHDGQLLATDYYERPGIAVIRATLDGRTSQRHTDRPTPNRPGPDALAPGRAG